MTAPAKPGTHLKKALGNGGSGSCLSNCRRASTVRMTNAGSCASNCRHGSIVWMTNAMELSTALSDVLCAEEYEPGTGVWESPFLLYSVKRRS